MFATWQLDDPNMSKISSLIALMGVTACFIIFFFNVHDRLFHDYHCESLESLEWQRQTIEAITASQKLQYHELGFLHLQLVPIMNHPNLLAGS